LRTQAFAKTTKREGKQSDAVRMREKGKTTPNIEKKRETKTEKQDNLGVRWKETYRGKGGEN
jgi:hypothetical protein